MSPHGPGAIQSGFLNNLVSKSEGASPIFSLEPKNQTLLGKQHTAFPQSTPGSTLRGQ